MSRRRIVQVASLVWSTTGAAVAVVSLPNVNDDVIVLVGLASVVLPLCAAAAALALRHRHDRLAGLLLVSSAATPTYFAYPANLPGLVVGLAVLAWPAVTLGDRRRPEPRSP